MQLYQKWRFDHPPTLPSNQFMGLAQQMLTKNIAYNIHVELAFIAPLNHGRR